MSRCGGTYTHCSECDILHAESECPLCEKKEDLEDKDEKVDDLQEKVAELEAKVKELEEEVEELLPIHVTFCEGTGGGTDG